MTRNAETAVLISGGFGGLNVGDEAILFSMVSALRQSTPNSSIAVLVDEARLSISTVKAYQALDLDTVNRRSLGRVIQALRSRDLILGGGQVLASGPLKLHLYLASLIFVNLLFRRRPVMVGAGVEPIRNATARFFVRWVLVRLKAICCRDERSKRRLVAAGIKSDAIFVTADLAFLGFLKTALQVKTLVVVAVEYSAGYPTASSETWSKLVAATMEEYPAYQVLAVAHDCRDDYDVRMLKSLEQHANPNDSCQFIVLESLAEALEIYSRAALVISSRMHPIILGAIFGAQVVPVGGRTKLEDVCTRLCVPVVPLRLPEAVTAIRRGMSSENTPGPLNTLQQQAWLNMTVLNGAIIRRGEDT